MGRPSRKPYADVERVHLTDQIIDLVVSGKSVAAAAEAVGVQYPTALRWYHAALARVYTDNAEKREEALGRELKTLELLQRALWPTAMRGHTRSVEVVLAVMDRRARYLGLDAPTKHEVDFTRVEGALKEITQIIDGETAAQPAPLLRITPSTP